MNRRVAVLGLGAMGLPIATCLANAWEVAGFDLAQTRLEQARSAGVRPATSVADAVTDAAFVVIAVRDGAQLEAVLFSDEGAAESMADGATVVVTSTVGAQAVKDANERLRATGQQLVDAPVSGGPVRAGIGDLLIMAGGEDAVLDGANELLETLASNLVLAGGIGDGQNMKVVNQLLCGVHTAAAAEALALASKLGLDLAKCVEVFGQGAAASFMLGDRGPRMVQQLHGETPELRSRLDVIGKDMGLVADLAKQFKIPTPLAAAGDHSYRIAESMGLSAQDDSIMAAFLAGRIKTGESQ